MTEYLPGFAPSPPRTHDADGDRWFTPPRVLAAVTSVLGAGWFDPCGDPASPAAALCAPASFDARRGEDGAELPWPAGHPVYANPPFSEASRWIRRCSTHRGPVIGLFPCRMEGAAWHDHVWGVATVVLPRGRLRFVGTDGRTHGCAMIGTAFVCWGEVDVELFSLRLRQGGLDNVVLRAMSPLASARVPARPRNEREPSSSSR